MKINLEEKEYKGNLRLPPPKEGESQRQTKILYQYFLFSFTPYTGKYIKSLILHPKQKILIDNEIEFNISLNIQITPNFIMEIFSFEDDVKVLESQSLMDEVKETHRKALERY